MEEFDGNSKNKKCYILIDAYNTKLYIVKDNNREPENSQQRRSKWKHTERKEWEKARTE